MNIIEWIVWGIGVLVLIFFFPMYLHREPLIGRLFKVFAILIVVGLIVTAFTQLSKFHLLWWIPASFILKDVIFHADLQWRFNRLSKERREKEQKDKVAVEHKGLVPECSEKQATDAEQANSSGSFYYEEIPCDTMADRQSR